MRCEIHRSDSRGEHLRIVEVVESSGHIGFSVHFFASTPEHPREITLRDLERLGGSWEWYELGAGRLYAVHLSPCR